MKLKHCLILVVCFCCLSGAVEAQAQQAQARLQLERFSRGLETLHASFEQRVISPDGDIEDGSSGEVWLRRPNLFRWQYGGDFPELVVADGTRVWIYDEILEQVTVRDQSPATVDSPLTLLTDPTRLDDQFEVREAGEAEDMQLLELRSRTPDTEFERILLGFGDDTLRLMILEDAFGLRTELRFGQIRRNPELEPGLFTFQPPATADVIGDLQTMQH